ncbi:hypothetical protein N8865_01435 [Francisellaceae bacterium]|nr:hypothetical protein [Francisellaceae bacterium]
MTDEMKEKAKLLASRDPKFRAFLISHPDVAYEIYGKAKTDPFEEINKPFTFSGFFNDICEMFSDVFTKKDNWVTVDHHAQYLEEKNDYWGMGGWSGNDFTLNNSFGISPSNSHYD